MPGRLSIMLAAASLLPILMAIDLAAAAGAAGGAAGAAGGAASGAAGAASSAAGGAGSGASGAAGADGSTGGASVGAASSSTAGESGLVRFLSKSYQAKPDHTYDLEPLLPNRTSIARGKFSSMADCLTAAYAAHIALGACSGK